LSKFSSPFDYSPGCFESANRFCLFQKPKWFTCEVIVSFVITRLALLLGGWLGFGYFRFPLPFPLPDVASSMLAALFMVMYSQWNWVA